MKDIILATDLAHHLKILPDLEKLAKNQTDLMSCTTEEKMQILDLCMTACDLSDQTKDWENTKNTAVSLHKLLFLGLRVSLKYLKVFRLEIK